MARFRMKAGARRKLLAFGGLGAVLGLAREARVAEATHQAEDLGLGIINPSGGGSVAGQTQLKADTVFTAFSVVQTPNSGGDAVAGVAGAEAVLFLAPRGVFGVGGGNSGYGVGGTGTQGNGGSLSGAFSSIRAAGAGLVGNGGAGGTSGAGGRGVGAFGGGSHSAPGPGILAAGGQNLSGDLAPGGPGVQGIGGIGANTSANTRTGIGVLGQSTSAEGVRGESTIGPGTLGVSSNGVGLFAVSHTNWGLYSQSPNYAGVFQGSVYIAGGLKLLGGFLTAVKHPDGSTRAAHGAATTEPIIEDFGRARLANGAAHVDLEPSFAALAGSSDYDLFLTPYGDCKGLYVASRTATSFDVQELQGGASTLDFAYRVVAKRRDGDRTRLAKLDHLDPLPTVKHTDVPALVPEPPRRNASDSPGAPAQPAAAPPPRR
ncbi:MAG: hypothetical protein U0821_19375 [Chloroflexota bacterium]